MVLILCPCVRIAYRGERAELLRTYAFFRCSSKVSKFNKHILKFDITTLICYIYLTSKRIACVKEEGGSRPLRTAQRGGEVSKNG